MEQNFFPYESFLCLVSNCKGSLIGRGEGVGNPDKIRKLGWGMG